MTVFAQIIESISHFLYLYPPSEESVKNQNMDIPSTVLMLLEIIYYISVSLMFTKSFQKAFGVQSKWQLGNLVGSLGSIAIELSALFSYAEQYFYGSSIYGLAHHIYDNYGMRNVNPYALSSWIFCILFADFLFYVMHRALHEVHFLWVFHQVHHSSQDYTLVNAGRRPIMGGFFLNAFILPFCFFFPPHIVFFHWYVNGSVYQFWLHTEFCPKLPWPIEWIFNTPSQHRVHHGVNPYAIDKNYAGFLCIWDRMFGTFAEERDWSEDRLKYGLVTPLEACDAITIQFIGPIRLVQKVYNTHGLGNKLRTIFYGPGWHVGAKTRLGDILPSPEPPLQHFKLYAPSINPILEGYILISSAVSAFSIVYFTAVRVAIPFEYLVLESILFWELQTGGMILTYKESNLPIVLETARCLYTLYLLTYGASRGSTESLYMFYFYYFSICSCFLVYYVLALATNRSTVQRSYKKLDDYEAVELKDSIDESYASDSTL